jgi:hypothetical protein
MRIKRSEIRKKIEEREPLYYCGWYWVATKKMPYATRRKLMTKMARRWVRARTLPTYSRHMWVRAYHCYLLTKNQRTKGK